MDDFELDIEFLISLVETTPVLWYKKDNIYKDRIKIKRVWTEVCACLSSRRL
jgi:hypothetical protein